MWGFWRTCGSKCRGEGGGIFPTLCVECCLICIYSSHYSHTAWWKPIFMENCCFCKRIRYKIICNPDLIFGLVEHLVPIDKIEHNNNDISWLYDSLKTILETCIAKHQLKSNYFLLKHHYMNLELTFPEVCLVDNLKKSIQYCMHLSAYLVVHHNTGACKPAANPTLWCIGCLVMKAVCRLTMVMSWGFIREEKYAWS